MIIGIMGLTGSGKSTVASLVAEKKGYLLFDMDTEFSEEYKDRNRAKEIVPEQEVKEYQREMVKRLLKLQENQVVVLAGFFLDSELPSFIESRSNVVWINLVTENFNILEKRLNARKNHFSTGVLALRENWPTRRKQVIGPIEVDCTQSVEQVILDCLPHITA